MNITCSLRLLAVALACAGILSCSGPGEKVFRKGTVLMDTMVTVTVVAASEEKAGAAIEKAFGVIAHLDGLLSAFSEQSEVSLVNRSAGIAPVKVSAETLELTAMALDVAEKTDGAFDITIGAESVLWDFVTKRRPDDAVIRERLGLVNYRLVRIDKKQSTVFLPKKGMRIDLGAVAKGYAADKAVEELKRQGLAAGLVAVAGDIRGYGRKPDRSGWSVGIRNPRMTGRDDEIMAVLELRDRAVSTSGDYERYFILDGKRYHHILDPGTGYPAAGCRSVSVVAPMGAGADAFSTAVFVLGPEKGMAVLEMAGLEGVIVDKDGRVRATPGLRDRIAFQGNN